MNYKVFVEDVYASVVDTVVWVLEHHIYIAGIERILSEL
jgi:hypothetical protein